VTRGEGKGREHGLGLITEVGGILGRVGNGTGKEIVSSTIKNEGVEGK